MKIMRLFQTAMKFQLEAIYKTFEFDCSLPLKGYEVFRLTWFLTTTLQLTLFNDLKSMFLRIYLK